MKTGENFRIVCTLTTEIDGDGGVGGEVLRKTTWQIVFVTPHKTGRAQRGCECVNLFLSLSLALTFEAKI